MTPSGIIFLLWFYLNSRCWSAELLLDLIPEKKRSVLLIWKYAQTNFNFGVFKADDVRSLVCALLVGLADARPGKVRSFCVLFFLIIIILYYYSGGSGLCSLQARWWNVWGGQGWSEKLQSWSAVLVCHCHEGLWSQVLTKVLIRLILPFYTIVVNLSIKMMNDCASVY